MTSQIITPGALLIKSLMPEDAKAHYDLTRVLDKKGVSELMSKIITEGGDHAHESIHS